MSKKSIVVYGPKACGKTRNADALRAAFGLNSIWDEGKESEPPRRMPRSHGELILTTDGGRFSGLEAIPFEDAMRRCGLARGSRGAAAGRTG